MPKAFAILAMAGSAFAEEYGLYEPAQNEARFFFFNSTGSAQTLSLLGAAILIAVIAYLVLPAPAQRAPTTTEMITNTTPMPNKITDMPASIGPTTTDSSTDSTLSHGSPCSRMSTRSSTTTTWTARRGSSARS